MSEWTSSGDQQVPGTLYTTPTVTSLAGGGHVVAWVDRDDGFRIVAQRFDAAGFKVGGEMTLNSDPIGNTMWPPLVAIDGRADGGFVATWTQDLVPSDGTHFRSLADVYFRTYDANGIAAGEPVLVNDTTLRAPGLAQAAVDVVTLSNGGFAVSWISTTVTQVAIPSSIYLNVVQAFDADGAPAGDAFQPVAPTASGSAPDRIVGLLPQSDGFYAICIADVAGNSWVTFQKFSHTGEALNEPSLALTSGIAVAAAALSNGNLLLARVQVDAWNPPTKNIALLIYDPETGGNSMAVVQLPDTNELIGIAELDAVATADGGFVLSWVRSEGAVHEIVAQRFDAAAHQVGDRISVTKGEPSGPLSSYEISAATEDGIIVTWDVGNAYSGIYIERFGPDVTPAISTEASELVAQRYVSMFGRAPDGEGLAFWASLLREGWSTAAVADTMLDTEPARAFYPTGLSDEEIVASFYVNVLGREADAGGHAFWTARMELPGASAGLVIDEIIQTVAGYDGTDPAGLESAALFSNRVFVAQYYGEHNASIEVATGALEGVTTDPATVEAAIASLELMGVSSASAMPEVNW